MRDLPRDNTRNANDISGLSIVILQISVLLIYLHNVTLRNKKTR